MHRFTIHSRWLPDATYEIPSKWSELTGAQLQKIAWLSSLPHRGPDLAKLFFLVLIESLPWWKRLRAQWFFIVSASLEDKANLLLLVSTFEQDHQFTDQKLPKIRLKSQKLGWSFVLLHGPTSKLGNATFWEFVQAEKYYLNYMEAVKDSPPLEGTSGGVDWLNKLVATLYREARTDYRPKIDTDIRIPLTDEGFKWRLKLVERLPMETKIAILMWFESCRSLIIKSFPTIFQKPTEPKKRRTAPQKLSPKDLNGQHWLQMISELAGSMDRYDAIGNTLVWTAFMDISHKIKKNEEHQRQIAQSQARRK